MHKNSRAQDQELQHLEEFTIEELQEKVHSTLAEILDHPPVEENPKATAIPIKSIERIAIRTYAVTDE